MIRPRKMKQIEMTVLERDIDRVIEFLGNRGIMQFSEKASSIEEHSSEEDEDDVDETRVNAERTSAHTRENLEKLKTVATYLEVELPTELEKAAHLPAKEEEELCDQIVDTVNAVSRAEHEKSLERQKIEATLTESRAFANLNVPFKELDQLSYLTLRVGRLDPQNREEMQETLTDRVVIVPLDDERVLAAASRRGRFVLDSELKKRSFIPIAIPEGYKGIPEELLASLENRMKQADRELQNIAEQKVRLHNEYEKPLKALTSSYLMVTQVEKLKARLVSTKSVYMLSGWVPADAIIDLVDGLSKLTEGRVAVRAFAPEEVKSIKNGTEKVPVSLKHGRFVEGFEPMVFSYGAPLYGTIDPTPFVAVFFTLFFGIMFGDVGQGFVLFLIGLLIAKKKLKIQLLSMNYARPLIFIGIASMIMGILYGSVFANETLLEKPIEAITGAITGHPVSHIIHLMPDRNNLGKLFAFFGFSIGIGVILNSMGLLLNIVNQYLLKNYEKAFFSKTGLAGLLFFWYAIFIAVRIILGGHFVTPDVLGLAIPVFCIFFGPVIWNLISGRRPIVKEGLFAFIIEGVVEILETVSSYISSTVSFLRVGAFALSHTVLSFIIFSLAELVEEGSSFGPLFSLAIVIFGNLVIILLEGMIVAIQVVRLQYYEFFSKFFTETGVAFAPFRFRREV
ncbi:MAG: V-type ATP synthase subunit I [Treponema sp.]|jgi:V/A-type H+-transporting ATPase subunit I|nr:V-type ATP synthase subunit I [Treponema sp.]